MEKYANFGKNNASDFTLCLLNVSWHCDDNVTNSVIIHDKFDTSFNLIFCVVGRRLTDNMFYCSLSEINQRTSGARHSTLMLLQRAC